MKNSFGREGRVNRLFRLMGQYMLCYQSEEPHEVDLDENPNFKIVDIPDEYMRLIEDEKHLNILKDIFSDARLAIGVQIIQIIQTEGLGEEIYGANDVTFMPSDVMEDLCTAAGHIIADNQEVVRNVDRDNLLTLLLRLIATGFFTKQEILDELKKQVDDELDIETLNDEEKQRYNFFKNGLKRVNNHIKPDGPK